VNAKAVTPVRIHSARCTLALRSAMCVPVIVL
jgi:hypothetical protein